MVAVVAVVAGIAVVAVVTTMLVHTETARCDVGGNQNRAVPRAEQAQDAVTFLLALVAVHALGAEAEVGVEEVGERSVCACVCVCVRV